MLDKTRRDPSRAAAFLAALGPEQVSAFVANLDARLTMVRCGEAWLPCTTSEGRTCYVCSPSVAYGDYAKEEVRALPGGAWIALATMPLLRLGRLLVSVGGLDRQVQVNNYLLSTNPPPSLDAAAVRDLLCTLATADPTRVIYWRSLNETSDRDLIDTLAQAGCTLIPARMVYLFDCRASPPRRHQNERRDSERLERSAYTIVAGADFSHDDFVRAATLYAMLYLRKYTPLNPHYTPLFLERLSGAGLLDLHGLRGPSGRLDGVIGFFDIEEVMTAPIVGYETALAQDEGLYRMLMAIGFERARTRRMLFNISAGAGSFKRLRGAEAALEYSLVYDRHRPWIARAANRLLAFLLSSIGVPLLRRYQS